MSTIFAISTALQYYAFLAAAVAVEFAHTLPDFAVAGVRFYSIARAGYAYITGTPICAVEKEQSSTYRVFRNTTVGSDVLNVAAFFSGAVGSLGFSPFFAVSSLVVAVIVASFRFQSFRIYSRRRGSLNNSIRSEETGWVFERSTRTTNRHCSRCFWSSNSEKQNAFRVNLDSVVERSAWRRRVDKQTLKTRSSGGAV